MGLPKTYGYWAIAFGGVLVALSTLTAFVRLLLIGPEARPVPAARGGHVMSLTLILVFTVLTIATHAIAAHKGPTYMRLLRGNVPLVLDEYDYTFELGKAKLLRDGNDVLVISSGFMTMRALEVAQALQADQVGVAVLHCPTI